jgi:hypothetical protein
MNTRVLTGSGDTRECAHTVSLWSKEFKAVIKLNALNRKDAVVSFVIYVPSPGSLPIRSLSNALFSKIKEIVFRGSGKFSKW